MISVTVHPTPTYRLLDQQYANQTLNLSATTSTGVASTGLDPAGFSSNLPNPTITNPASGNSGSYSVVASSARGTAQSGGFAGNGYRFAVNAALKTDPNATNTVAAQRKCLLTAGPLVIHGAEPGGFWQALFQRSYACCCFGLPTQAAWHPLCLWQVLCICIRHHAGNSSTHCLPPTVISNSPVT